uniref:Uncharacterized protein n=1 Tax=viral metagenome TaxID=1070528 RepID=A0A6C0JH12_9ZZZZ
MLGGSIAKNDVFKKIISIGYELETASLAKFTKVFENAEGPLDDDVLLNTDTAGPNLEEVLSYSSERDGELFFNRKDELLLVDSYTTASLNQGKKTVDRNVKFWIANDITSSLFSNYLNRLCLESEEKESDAKTLADKKNNLYTIETGKGEIYKLHFETLVPKECGLFADVEWIFTYYKPKRGDNLIIDTFVNVMKNLLLHLDSLELHPCKLVAHLNEDDSTADTVLVRKPEQRSLFYLPDTNMYYLQTQYVDELLVVNDICITPQMTFSVHIKDLIDVFKEIIAFNGLETESLRDSKTISENRYTTIVNIEKCIDELIIEYNKNNSHKFLDKKEEIQIIKNYLFMILYKIYIYLNVYLVNKKANASYKKYLKDSLYFNSRHANYDLYIEMRKCISEYFLGELGNERIHDIICKLVIQENVLEKYLINDSKNVRKKAFSIDKKYELEPTNRNYGNPEYSLLSYFQFFERPSQHEDNYDGDGELMHDWFRSKRLDVFSTQMDVKKNIVLAEVRMFQRLLSNYLISMNDDTLLETMTNGACNRIMRNSSPTISQFSIATLRRFVELYDKASIKPRKTEKAKRLKKTVLVSHSTRKRCPNGSRKNKLGQCIKYLHR